MGQLPKALTAGAFIGATSYALFRISTLTPQTIESIELINRPGEALNIIGIFCLGLALVGITFAIRQHQSPQGLNEKS